ncbi:MAG: amidohydrolase [Candidatus Sericytochromatia bacterium]|nr:amidohydrolase [Candidatus Sericytochromatia bacterium]
MPPTATTESMIALRREIHRQPEAGFQETQTADLVVRELARLGIPYQAGIATTGVMGTITGTRPGKTLLIRADMDALPITERTGREYASQVPGMMHACGHDGHTAMLIGLAERLLSVRDRLAGTVKLIFQPAEEGPGGAQPMIEAGVLQNPDVDAAFAFHVWNSMPTGKVAATVGPVMACTDQFVLRIKGRGGHGAMPECSVDAIVVMAHVVTALQSIVSRQVSPLDTVVVTLGTVHGGYRHNVIADQVELTGTVRTFSPQMAAAFPHRIERIVQGVTEAFGAKFELEYERTYPAVINDAAMTALMQKAIVRVIGSENLITDERSMGGEDMAYFLEKVPGCYFFVGSENPAIGCAEPHHSPYFDFDEAAMGIGVDILVEASLAFLAP